jgi:hypothetical protein
MAKYTSAKTMTDVSAGYEKFIADKKTTSKGKKIFDKTIKAASKPRGSK